MPASKAAQPRAHLLQAPDLARLDATVGHRTDVEEQVAVAAGAAHQRLQAFGQRLHRVLRFPGPLFANRDATLPRALVLVLAHALLGGVEVLGQAVAVVDQEVGFKEFARHPVDGHRAVVLGLLAEAVEPEEVDAPVVREQFAHLGLEVGEVAIVPVGGEGVGVAPVGLRVVEAELEAGGVAGVGEFADDIATERANRAGNICSRPPGCRTG